MIDTTFNRLLKKIVPGASACVLGTMLAVGAVCAAPAASAANLLAKAIHEQRNGHWARALADVQTAIRDGNATPAATNLLIAAARQQHHIGQAYLLIADLASRHLISASAAQHMIAALIRHGPVQTMPEELIHARNHSGYGTQQLWAWRDYLLGVAEAESDRPRQAINWLEAAISAQARFWPATELLADQQATVYHFAAAQHLLEQAIADHWHRRQAYQDLTGVFSAQDRLRRALILAQIAAGKYPDNPEMQVLAAQVYGLRQQQNIQQVVLTEVMRKFPHFKPAYLDLLDLAQSDGDTTLTDKISRQYIRSFPGDIFSIILQSRLAAQQGNATLASRILTEALRTHQANVQLWIARIELALALTHIKAAIALAHQAILLNSDSLMLHQTLAQLLENKPGQAIAVLQIFARQHRQSAAAQQAYVQMMLQLKALTQCRDYLHPLIQRYPNARWVQRSWADYLDAAGKYQAERNYLQRITAGRSARVEDLLLLATVDYHLHDLSAEEAAYKKVLQLEPANSMAANDLGYTLTIENRELPYAEKIIEIAVKNHPGDAAARDSLGWVLYKQGHFQRALAQLKQAVQLPGGQSAEGLEHLGAAMNKLGHAARAILIWKVALKQIGEVKTLSKHQRIIKKRIELRIKKAKLWRNLQKAGGKMM
jgi:Tfp pilus assembly protein PilF